MRANAGPVLASRPPATRPRRLCWTAMDGAGRGGVEPGAEHAPYGGVVPEIAARAHLAHLPGLVREVLARAGLGFDGLGGVAATGGPGLIGGLIVGSWSAKGIALARGLPYVAVNHLEAHALTARLPGLVEGGAPFPYLLLLVSGGHCQCVGVAGVGRTRGWAARWTTRWARRSTRSVNCSGWAGRAGRRWSGWRPAGGSRALRVPAADAWAVGLRFQFLRVEDGGGAGGRAARRGALPAALAADLAAGFQRAVTEVMADRAGSRDGDVRARGPRGCWWWRAGWRRTVRSARRWPRRRRRGGAAGGSAGAAVHRQRGDGRVGGDRAAPAGAGGRAGFRPASALAAGRADAGTAGNLTPGSSRSRAAREPRPVAAFNAPGARPIPPQANRP